MENIGYLEILGLLVAGGGTLALILSIFLAIYIKQEKRLNREALEKMRKERGNNEKI